MKCRDFERAWNELIDADASGGAVGMPAPGGIAALPGRPVAETERALLDHAVECPACRQVAARYQALRRAIREWGPPPAPPAGFVEQILAGIQTPAPSDWPVNGSIRRKPLRSLAVATLAASAAIVIATALLNRALLRTPRNGPPAALHITRIDSETGADARALNVALAEATAATWDLARSASEPAAWISRQVLDTATGPGRNPDQGASVNSSGAVAASVSVPSLDTLAPDAAAAGAMLQQVGDRLTTGVRPLSATARHAFGFLLRTAVGKPDVQVNPPTQKGA